MPTWMPRPYTPGEPERALTWALRACRPTWYQPILWALSSRYRKAKIARTQAVADEMVAKILRGDFA